MKNLRLAIALLTLLWLAFSGTLTAQENYEIQVYPSQTIGKGLTIAELHSNVSPFGLKGAGSSDEPHPFHETLEISHGFTPNFEIGIYQFMNVQSGMQVQMIGTHLRPRISLPAEWGWPVGLSLSAELGLQNKNYLADTWSLEIRPIIDKDFKWIYLAFNPVLGKSLKGPNATQQFSFEPCVKAAFHVSPKADLGLEYYGSTGELLHPVSFQKQEHLLFASLDLDLHPNWEFNFGTGLGLTDSTDQLIVKLILGYQFGKKR